MSQCVFSVTENVPQLSQMRSITANMPHLALLPQVVAKKYRNYDIPSDMTGVWRYLKSAYARDEFTNTCAADSEIELAYKDVARRLAK